MRQIMKKRVLATLLLAFFFAGAHAQSSVQKPVIESYNQLGSLSLLVPVDDFGHSHVAGAAFGYSWSRGHFGKELPDSIKKIGFLATASAEYFLGKKATTAGNPFRFGDYWNLAIMPGMIYRAFKYTDLSFAAGPEVTLYRSALELGVEGRFAASYFIQPGFSIGPVIIYKKKQATNPLWSVGVTGSFSF